MSWPILGFKALLSREHVAAQSGIDIGLRSNGRRLILPYPGLPHILIAGVTGAGKSSILNSLMYALAPLKNVAVVGVDLKRVELSPWRNRMTLLAVDGDEVDATLIQLRYEIERREHLLESIGEREWRDELGPRLVFLIDEFAELTVVDLNRLIDATQTSGDKEGDRAVNAMMKRSRSSLGIRSGILESFARKCRALGVTIVVATQYPTADVIDTQVRSQFALRFMCRVSSDEQVKVALGNGMEEHVDVRDLSPAQPGSFMVAGLESKVITARASWIDDSMVRARVLQTAHRRIDPYVLFAGPSDTPLHSSSKAPVGTGLHLIDSAEITTEIPKPELPIVDDNDGVTWA